MTFIIVLFITDNPEYRRRGVFLLYLVNDYFVSDDFNWGKQCIWLSTDRESVMCTAGKGVVKEKKNRGCA